MHDTTLHGVSRERPMSPGTSQDPLGARQGGALTDIGHLALAEQAGVVTINRQVL